MYLDRTRWLALAAAHEQRADALTRAHRERRVQGRAHPVADFLFVYYTNSPARLRRWHPGPGVVLAEAASSAQASWRDYRVHPDGSVSLDIRAFMARRGEAVSFVRDLIAATLSRSAVTSCFGMHEWAMVYRQAPQEVRHEQWPLRLGPQETDEVVRAHTVRCSHFDAYRFFTAEAETRNTIRPTREGQIAFEQPGCLHAGMDLYKWSFKLAPGVPGDLVLDAFELASQIRVLDMRASPYDVTSLGLEPVRIETREGKAEYAEAQRDFARRSNALRHRLVDVCDALLEGTG